MNILGTYIGSLFRSKRNVGAILLAIVALCRALGIEVPENAEEIAKWAGGLILAIGVADGTRKKAKGK